MGFFDSFTGKSQSKAAGALGQRNAAQINNSYAQARTDLTGGKTEAMGYLDPYAQGGQRGQSIYEDSLGLNGEAGGQNAMAAYRGAANPYFDYAADQAQRGMDRQSNARGGLYGGANAAAVAKARMGMGYQDYQNWQNQLRGLGQQGAGIAGTQASMAYDHGGRLGDYEIGRGSALVGNDTNATMARIQAQNAGVNNMLKFAGGIGGSFIQGFTPGAGGVSAFGNMASGFR